METHLLSTSIIEQYSELIQNIAKNIVDNVVASQRNVYVFHGDASEDKRLLNLPKISDGIFENVSEYLVDTTNILLLSCKQTDSLIFNGILNGNVKVESKINHCLFRKCSSLHVDFNSSPISGVDILQSSDVFLDIPHEKSVNIEYSDNILMSNENNKDFHLSVLSSTNVFINAQRLPVGFFTNSIFTNDLQTIRPPSDINMLLNS